MRVGMLMLVGSCMVGAFVGGWAVARTSAPPEPSPPPVKPNNPVARALSGARGMVCLRPGLAEEAEAALETLRPALRWCESRLERCEHRGTFRRHDWPEETTVESPDAWTETVREALDACGVELEFDLIECTEYPCVAAFRPPPGTDSSDALFRGPYAEYRDALEKQIAACEPLRQAFRGAKGDGHVDVWPYDAPCGDGIEPLMALTVLHDDGPAARARDDDGGDSNEEIRWMYRRAEDVAAAWQCGEGDAG